MEILIFFILHWYLSLFCQTFFHHRYSAHQMFKMSRFWERVFYFLSFLTQGSSYLSPYAYGILHRMHHDHADTEKDPHSPKYDKTLFKMMWRTKKIYCDIFKGRTEIEERYKGNLPHWLALEKFADFWIVRISWGVLYTLFYIKFATAWWMFLPLPIHYLMGPFHGAVINWFAHKYGYVNFKLKDTSKNFLPFDFLMLGESYHNNHHTRGNKANFGFRWFEFDPVYPIIRIFNFLRIIRLNPKSI